MPDRVCTECNSVTLADYRPGLGLAGQRLEPTYEAASHHLRSIDVSGWLTSL